MRGPPLTPPRPCLRSPFTARNLIQMDSPLATKERSTVSAPDDRNATNALVSANSTRRSPSPRSRRARLDSVLLHLFSSPLGPRYRKGDDPMMRGHASSRRVLDARMVAKLIARVPPSPRRNQSSDAWVVAGGRVSARALEAAQRNGRTEHGRSRRATAGRPTRSALGSVSGRSGARPRSGLGEARASPGASAGWLGST